MDLQLWAFSPGGTSPTILPQPIKVDAGMVLSDVSSMTITYPLGAPGIEILGSYCDVELRYRVGDEWVCPPQGRFALMDTNVDPVGEATQPTRTYTLVSWGWLLSGVLQAKIDGLDDQGSRQFTNRSPAEVVGILLSEAIDAGFTDAMSFSNLAGTGGWAPAYQPGKSAADILSESRDQGFCEWLMQSDGAGCGRLLTVYATVGADLSTGDNPVTVRYSTRGEVAAAPSKISARDMAAAAVVAGDAGHYLKLTNPGADVPYGLLQTYVGASGISDAGGLEVVAQARLDAGKTVRAEHTRQVAFEDAEYLPLVDYNLGDTILAPDESGALVPLRVRQVTITYDSGRWGGNLVLGDRFTERALMLDRRVRQLTAGNLWGSGTLPAQPGAGWVAEQSGLDGDTTTGAAPSAPTVTVRLGVAQIEWDGAGTPDNYDHTEVHVGESADFTPTDATLVGTMWGAGLVIVADLDYNATRWARLVNVMRSGVKSPPSPSTEFVVTPLVDTDMIGTIIDGANIISGSVNASDKVIANTITGRLIQGLAISTGHLAANAVTADKIDVGSIRTAILTANIISTGMLQSGAITASKINVTSLGQISPTLGDLSDGSIAAVTMYASKFISSTGATGPRIEISNTAAASNPGFSIYDDSGNLGFMRMSAGSINMTGQSSSGSGIVAVSYDGFTVNIGGSNVINFSRTAVSTIAAKAGLSISAVGSLNLSGTAINVTGPIVGSGDVQGNRILAVSPPTSSNSANVYYNSSTGLFYQPSSLSAGKMFKRKIRCDYAILDLTPKTWVDRTLRGQIDGYDLRTAGFVAEEVAALSDAHGGVFEPLLIRNAETRELEGLAYDRFLSFVIPVLKDMDARLRKAGL